MRTIFQIVFAALGQGADLVATWCYRYKTELWGPSFQDPGHHDRYAITHRSHLIFTFRANPCHYSHQPFRLYSHPILLIPNVHLSALYRVLVLAVLAICCVILHAHLYFLPFTLHCAYPSLISLFALPSISFTLSYRHNGEFHFSRRDWDV